MKHILTILVIIILSSCTKDDAAQQFTYDYLPEQPNVIKLSLIIDNEANLQLDDMLMEINADYYNRYGIAVEIEIEEFIDIELTPTEVYLPNPKQDGKIRVYLVQQEKIVLSAYAYAVTNRRVIVLGDRVQDNRTLAHEVGHILGLDHIKSENNVMQMGSIAWSYDRPNDFLQDQIDTILTNLEPKINLELTSKVTNLPIIIHD